MIISLYIIGMIISLYIKIERYQLRGVLTVANMIYIYIFILDGIDSFITPFEVVGITYPYCD